MNLPDVVDTITPSIVALGLRIAITPQDRMPSFPQIVGTGFVVDPRGLIATNRHVVEALEKLPNAARFVGFFIQRNVPNDQIQVGVVLREITQFWHNQGIEFEGRYFGDTNPDLAFLTVDVKDLPSLKIRSAPHSLRLGTEVVTVGFPMGDQPLSVFGGEIPSQMYPFARRGIVSSVLPCPCENPHGFTIDMLSVGGQSGSPICGTDDGAVLGLLYGGYVGAPLTYGVPGHILSTGLTNVLEQWTPNSSYPTLTEVVEDDFSKSLENPMTWGRINP